MRDARTRRGASEGLPRFERETRRAGRAIRLGALGALLLACGGSPQGGGASDSASVDAAPASAGAARVENLAGLRFEIPEGWASQQPSTSMRLAEYRVSGPGGDAELVVFRFPGGGGSADANVSRWVSQFSQPDGSDSGDRAVVQRAENAGLKLTRLDVRGSYQGQQMPGAPAQPAIADARLLALVVEGTGDPYFFKLLGPADAVAPWTDAWDVMTQSMTQQ